MQAVIAQNGKVNERIRRDSAAHKEILGAGSGSEIDESGKCQCDSEGKEHGTSHEAGGQGDIAAAVFFRYQLGYGGLDAGGIEGIADSVNRKDKLIDAQIFRT